jgi:hypothetical protein
MRIRTITLFGVISITALVTVAARRAQTSAVDDVKAVIETSYIHGAFNELNPEAMRSGFHPDFAIFSADGEDISKFPIGEWAGRVERTKDSPDFDPAKNVWEHKLPVVDVTGGAAFAKVELFKDGTHVYTDYLSLLEFDSGWRIVAKVYHQHTEN